MDIAVLRLASSASADLRYRRAESLLPCGLTQDELNELLGRFTGSSHAAHASGAGGGAAASVPRAGEGRKASGAVPAADIGGGVQVGSGGPAGGEPAGGDKAADS